MPRERETCLLRSGDCAGREEPAQGRAAPPIFSPFRFTALRQNRFLRAPAPPVVFHEPYNFAGSLDSVDNFEEQLLSLGALRLAKKPDGTLMRPDLADAEKIGRQGFGMWADPRVPK